MQMQALFFKLQTHTRLSTAAREAVSTASQAQGEYFFFSHIVSVPRVHIANVWPINEAAGRVHLTSVSPISVAAELHDCHERHRTFLCCSVSLLLTLLTAAFSLPFSRCPASTS